MRVKFDEPLKISGPYGDMEAKFQPCQDDEAPNNLLIMAHGFRGSMEGGGRAAYLSQMASMFVNVLRFNFTGSQILSHQIEELEAVLDFVQKKYHNPRLFLLGRSMGGAASLVTASRRSDIAGLALWATPNDLHATFKNALGDENYSRLKGGKTLDLEDERGSITLTPDFVSDLDKYDLQQMLRAWQKRPLLIIHGSNDETVDVSQAQRSFALAGRPKKLVIVPGADHSFTNHSNKAAEEVITWLRAHL